MGEFEVYLQGGPPWGFRLQGGREFRMPIRIAKVEPSGKAHNGGVQVGDHVTEIEEVSTANMYHTEALTAVKKAQYSLSLLLSRPEKKVETHSPQPSDSVPEISKTKVSVVIGPKRSVSSERLSSDDEGRGRSEIPQGQTYMKKLVRNATAEADFPRPIRSKSLSRNAQPDSGSTSPRSDYSSNSLPRNTQNGFAHPDYSTKSLPRTRTKSTTDANSKAPSWYKDMYKEMNTSMEKESLLTKLLASDAKKGAFRKYDGATSPFDRSTDDVQKAATFEDVPRRLRREGDGRSIANHPNRKSLPNLHSASFNFADHNNSSSTKPLAKPEKNDGHDLYRHIQKGGNIPETGLASKPKSPGVSRKWETLISPPDTKPEKHIPVPEPIKSKNISIEYNNPPDFLELRRKEIKNKELEQEREEIRNQREQERLMEEQRLLEQRSRDLRRIEDEKRRLELKEEELKRKEKLLLQQQEEHEGRRLQDDLRRKENEEMRLLKLKEEELRRKEEMLLKQEQELEELKQMKLKEEKQRQEEEEQLLKQLLEEEEQKRRDAEEVEKQRQLQKQQEEEDLKRLQELEEKRKQREAKEEKERLQKLKEKQERLQKQREEEERLQKLKEEELRLQKLREEEEKERKRKEEERERKHREEERERKRKEEEAELERQRVLKLKEEEEERERLRQQQEEELQRLQEEEEQRRLLQLKEEELRLKEEELMRKEAEQREQERLLEEALDAPPLPLYGLAKYSFHPQNEGELKFKKGSLISIIEAVDENWIEGELNGTIGIFPISYVELLDHKPGEVAPKPQPKPQPKEDKADEGVLDAKYIEPSGTLLVSDTPVEESEVAPTAEVPVENGLSLSEHESSENGMVLEDLETTPDQSKKDVDVVDIAAAVKADINPGLAYAKYAFRAETDAELSFSKGVEITLLKRVDDNWYEGEINGKIGILPVNYVRVEREPLLIEPPSPEPEPELEPEPQPIVVAQPISLADIVTEPTPEKTLKPVSERDRKPSAESILDKALSAHEQGKKAKENASEQCNGINGHDELVNGESLLDDFIGQGEPYKAIYKFVSSNEDEIELRVGDIVHVLEKCDDNWFIGTSERSGAFGTFPGNYVVPL